MNAPKLSIQVVTLVSFFCQPVFSQWIQQPSPVNEVFERIRFFDANTGWLTDDKTRIYKTSDAGVTWSVKDSLSGGFQTIGVSSHDTVLYGTWSGVPPYVSRIRRTSDGGSTWQTADSLPFLCSELLFITNDIGFAAGGLPDSSSLSFAPFVRKTTDAGLTWQTVLVGSYADELRGISFADPFHGWAVNFGGIVYHSTNGGDAWVVQDSLPFPMRDIQFTTRDSGWAVGGLSGLTRIARTVDGGIHWSDTAFGGSSLLEIQMLDSRTGWAVGPLASYILRTTDGGETWERQQMIPGTGGGCYSISMVNENLGWGASTGSVYKTVNGGTVGVGHDPGKPAHYILDQNYPNPFNPVTTITYELPHATAVTLSVYNVVGQQVATLVDEEQGAGSHSVQFRPAGLASGVYLYRLQTADFTAARKLLIVQ